MRRQQATKGEPCLLIRRGIDESLYGPTATSATSCARDQPVSVRGIGEELRNKGLSPSRTSNCSWNFDPTGIRFLSSKYSYVSLGASGIFTKLATDLPFASKTSMTNLAFFGKTAPWGREV